MICRILGCAITVLALVGCSGGERTYPVTGKVVFPDNRPLTGGTIQFRCTRTTPPTVARGKIQSDGTFTLTTSQPGDGAVAGDHQVLIAPDIPRDTDQLRGPAKALAMTGGIHSRFTSYDTSQLQFTVEAGKSNEFVVQVQPPR